jgi:AraC family transcriptional regulator
VPRWQQQRLDRVRSHIEAHLDQPLRLPELAGIANLSPYHFSRSFKDVMGVGPRRYIIQRRIAKAEQLIREDREELAVIAYMTGFHDQGHMTVAFRRVTGITPGAYRRAVLGAREGQHQEDHQEADYHGDPEQVLDGHGAGS